MFISNSSAADFLAADLSALAEVRRLADAAQATPLASMSATTRAPLSASKPCQHARAGLPELASDEPADPVCRTGDQCRLSAPAFPSHVSSRRSTSEITLGCREFEVVVLGDKNDRSRCSRAPKNEEASSAYGCPL
jgi:hypothetical protein